MRSQWPGPWKKVVTAVRTAAKTAMSAARTAVRAEQTAVGKVAGFAEAHASATGRR